MQLWFLVGSFLLFCIAPLQATEWIRAGVNTNQPVWGIRGGLMWGLPPGFLKLRGLIRIAYPTLANGRYDLINFVAIEPIVKGRRGFSELEQSQLDHSQGKRLWAVDETDSATMQSSLTPGRLFKLSSGVEQLDVVVRAEPYENGAKVRIIVSQRSDAPDEIQMSLHAESGSVPMDYCILTATMGNRARARLLWLKEEVVNSRKLYAAYTGAGFAPETSYPLERLGRNARGDVLVAVTTDEDRPESIFPFPDSQRWHYGGAKVTQYWKKLRGAFRDDLQATVNARYTYWQTRQPIPGGVAFENFELREGFHEGQRFVFGVTKKTPAELGLEKR